MSAQPKRKFGTIVRSCDLKHGDVYTVVEPRSETMAWAIVKTEKAWSECC